MFIFHAINNDLADLFTEEEELQIHLHLQHHHDHDQNQLSAETNQTKLN